MLAHMDLVDLAPKDVTPKELAPEELDAGPRKTAPGAERFCAATGTVRPVADMIRFVVSPDGLVVADLKRRLPGRGMWITATRQARGRRGPEVGYRVGPKLRRRGAHVRHRLKCGRSGRERQGGAGREGGQRYRA